MVVILRVIPARQGRVAGRPPQCQPADYVFRELASGTNLMLASGGPTRLPQSCGHAVSSFPGIEPIVKPAAFCPTKAAAFLRTSTSVVIVLMQRCSSSRQILWIHVRRAAPQNNVYFLLVNRVTRSAPHDTYRS